MAKKHLVRIPDWGVTEQTVVFADDFIIERIPENADVLDIGCGRGLFDDKLAPGVRSVTGVDIMREEIATAQARKRHANIEFVEFDAEKLTEFEGEFDAALSRFCFHHLDMDKVAEGIKARLKPGGRLIAIDCLEDYWKLSASFYILFDAIRRLGIPRMTRLAPRLMFFFTPKRIQHVRSDIARIRAQKRYHFQDFKAFYQKRFPGAEVGMVGCAAYIDWRKP